MNYVTVKCPWCNRKITVEMAPDADFFTMPDHENYTKDAQCPKGGKTFERVDSYIREQFTGSASELADISPVLAALALLCWPRTKP